MRRLRYKLSDWISGGKLSGMKAHISFMSDHVLSLQSECKDLNMRLDRIAAQETPNANATVRRMASIARGME